MVQIYPIGATFALKYAAQFLKQAGLELIDHPTPEVTHLLLDVPSFGNDGTLRSGGNLEKILEMLPQYITVVGGNLDAPELEDYKKWDFLREEDYLAQNAAITADCALQVAAPLLTTTFAQSPALIIGWGRIGKCLGRYLQDLGCEVTVGARKKKDRAMAKALGYHAIDIKEIPKQTHHRILFNTATEQVLTREQLAKWSKCVKIDLASRKGLDGEDVVWARGLPGVYAPESSGRLIADTFLRKLKEEGR